MSDYPNATNHRAYTAPHVDRVAEILLRNGFSHVARPISKNDEDIIRQLFGIYERRNFSLSGERWMIHIMHEHELKGDEPKMSVYKHNTDRTVESIVREIRPSNITPDERIVADTPKD